MRDVDAVQRLPGLQRPAARHDGRILGERAHRRLDTGGERGLVATAASQHGDAEPRAMVVVVVGVMVMAVMVMVVVIVGVAMVVAVRVMVVRVMVVAAGAQRMTAGGQLVDARPLERVLRLEERGIDRQRALQIERADAEHGVDGDVRVARAEHPGRGVDGAHAALDALQRRLVDEVRLVGRDHVREGHLLARFLHLVEVPLHMARIDQRHDGIERELMLEVVVEEEGLRDRTGVGHARGLDDDVVEAVAALEQLAEDAQQVAAHRAADAAVVGLEDLLLGADDELVVDADLAELVLDDGDALAVLLREDAVEEGRLARPEEARQHGDGDTVRGSHDGAMIP